MTELQNSNNGFLTLDTVDKQISFEKIVKKNSMKGVEIYIKGLQSWRIWINMAVSEIRRRYKRTLLGPFWVTLSIAIFIGTIGLVFPTLWHTDSKTFLPFFASGYIIWIFISTSITEACGTFINMRPLIKQLPLPYSIYANNVVASNMIILMHHMIVYVAVMILYEVPLNLNTLLFFPGILILCLTFSWVSILFGLWSARFQDIKQIVVSFLQIALFVTPILWMPSQLGNSWQSELCNLNPLAHWIAIARAPLLGQQPTLTNWLVSITICILGWLYTMKVLNKYYRHLVFWL